MLKNNITLLFKLEMGCMFLFFIFGAVAEILSTLLVYLKTSRFLFDGEEIFSTFFESGYIGGAILGLGIWIKILLNQRKNRSVPSSDRQ